MQIHTQCTTQGYSQADHLMDLANSNTPPAWALGLAPWPPYLIPLQETVVKLIHKNATEILKVTAESLRTLSKSKGQIGEAYLLTVQRLRQRLAWISGVQKSPANPLNTG